MVNLIIHNRLKLFGKQIECQVPEAWEELTPGQLVSIARVLFAGHDTAKRDLLLLSTLTGLSIQRLQRMDAAEIYNKLLPLCAWVTAECCLTKQLIPRLSIDGIHYYGPYDHLRNLTFVEFDAAEQELAAWQESQDDEQLYRFVATLYRPKKQNYDTLQDIDGDPRQAFNGNLTGYYAHRLREYAVNVDTALAIVLFYKGCRHFMKGQHPRIFDGASNTETNESTESTYFALMRMIAEKGIYGNFEHVEQLYLYTALKEMECVLDEQEAIRKQIEEMKNRS